MVDVMNKIKRPLIFLRNLPDHELISLNGLIGFYKIYGNTLPQDLQIFTHKSGKLDTADDLTVDETEEVICTTYQEFITKWGEYRLWIMLQTE